MEIKVGDYVRNSHFGIGRINRDYYGNDGKHWYNVVFKCYQDNDNHCGITENTCGFEISSKLIDLIQVGDYVNGNKITCISGTTIYTTDDQLYYDKEDNFIKSIVTKEQFSQMEYKINE